MRIPPAGATVEEIHQWWISLDQDTQAEVLERYGDELGRVDGIPLEVRTRCNERRLDRELRGLTSHPAPAMGWFGLRRLWPRTAVHNPPAVRELLEAVRAEGRQAFLIDYSSRGTGTLTLAIGDPARADRVVSYVPGSGTPLCKAAGALESAMNVLRTTERLDAALKPRPTTAMIVRIYQTRTPVPLHILLPGIARKEAPRLARFQHGLHVIRPRTTGEANAPRYVVIGHSYGSIVAAVAAKKYGLATDAVAINGVGGIRAGTAGELGVPEVYATLMPQDPLRIIQWLRIPHNRQPATTAFGATVFASGPGPTGLLPGRTSVTAHCNYFTTTLAQHNNAEIIRGHPPLHSQPPEPCP